MSGRIAEQFVDYWAGAHPGATNIAVNGLSQFHGGASRDTYRLTLTWRDVAGSEHDDDLVLRIMPPGCLISDEISTVETEFLAMTAVHGTGIPVPKPHVLEKDESLLGGTFVVTEEIKGCEGRASKLGAPPYSEHLEDLGRQFYGHLGHLATLDPDAGGLGAYFERPDPAGCWSRELAVWEKEFATRECPPQPVLAAGLRWLRNHPPPPAKRISIVHGDYRAGNFLYDDAGTMRAVLDWELCHLGDPVEDVAWSMMPQWSGSDPRPGRMVERSDAIRLWEQASGLEVDPQALFWWEVFGNVKLAVIVANAAVEYRDGNNPNPMLVVAAWYGLNHSLQTIADLLRSPACH